MAENLFCWSCGGPLETVMLPIGRRDECPACGADLHVCRQCTFYDPAVSQQCREPMADEVQDKERANFCDYFRPAAGSPGATHSAEADAALARLAGVFGGDQAPRQGGDLAGEAAGRRERRDSEAEEARRRLERMFGGGKE